MPTHSTLKAVFGNSSEQYFHKSAQVRLTKGFSVAQPVVISPGSSPPPPPPLLWYTPSKIDSQAARSHCAWEEVAMAADPRMPLKLSTQVGLSCLWLGLPAPWIMYNGHAFVAMFNLAVAVCSILADYYFIGSVWDDIDRAVACSYIGWLIYLSVHSNGIPLTVAVFLTLIVGPFFYSRSATSRQEWVFRHSVWHAFGTLVQFLIMYGVFNPGCYACPWFSSPVTTY